MMSFYGLRASHFHENLLRLIPGDTVLTFCNSWYTTGVLHLFTPTHTQKATGTHHMARALTEEWLILEARHLHFWQLGGQGGGRGLQTAGRQVAAPQLRRVTQGYSQSHIAHLLLHCDTATSFITPVSQCWYCTDLNLSDYKIVTPASQC